MIDDLRGQFTAQFLEVAKRRVAHALLLLAPDAHASAPQLLAELHTLAGEASLLGFDDVAAAASEGEIAARRWNSTKETPALVACARAVRYVARLLEGLGTGATAAEPAAAERRHRVLVVDDSALGAALLRDILEHHGFEAASATDAPAAAEAARRLRPDAVLCDVHLPNCSVTELVATLRAVPEAATARLLLVSGLSEGELAAEAKEAAADGFVSKREGLDAVVARLAAMLGG